VLRRHFADRVHTEEAYFGHDAALLDDRQPFAVLPIAPKELNGPHTVEFLRRREVDVVLVYGTGLVKGPLLSAFAGRMINMHLGLSPYYRGTATNFYPLVNDEPEYVGATIHLIDAGIDSGPILHHARPQIVADDMPHTVGCKAILAGIDKVKLALREFEAGRLTPVPQWRPTKARLYLRRDYHPSQVVRLYELIEGGLFPRYVERAARVAGLPRLVP
jgi:methionyl-tRNA formyltransferase